MGAAPGRALEAVLERARHLGFLGPGDISGHVSHSLAFASALDAVPGRVVDLGSGGGVPALVLAAGPWAEAAWTLVEASERRCGFLTDAVGALGLAGRVAVRRSRAEDAGRDPDLRGRADTVVARGFGPPAVTAECAAPLLAVGGHLVVSEPPDPRSDRGPAAGLAELGLDDEGLVASAPTQLRRLRLTTACPERYPRRVGVPAKRPLW
jgi:16S rRNA (guanine527-N7)-methyltransferase